MKKELIYIYLYIIVREHRMKPSKEKRFSFSLLENIGTIADHIESYDIESYDIETADTMLFRIYESYHYQNIWLSYNDSSIKMDTKPETLQPEALKNIISRRQLDLLKYWNTFSLSISEHTRIFSNQIHPDDAILLWNYILVNFFRLKVYNEQGHFIHEYVQLQHPEKNTSQNIQKNIQKKIEETYFWKIESAAIQFSLEGNFDLYLTRDLRFSNISEKHDSLYPNDHFCDREMDLIQRLGLLYRAIYVLIVQDGIFASILRSEQLEIIPKSTERMPSHQEMLSQWIKESGESIQKRDTWSDNCLMHNKFFALCFLVSFSQVQGMWRTLFLGQKLYFSDTKALYFRKQFDMFSDNISAILGDTMISFSSVLEEKSIFDPKLSKQYLKVFRSLYQMIQCENPEFLSFHPLLQPNVIPPTTILDIKNICSQTEGWNSGVLSSENSALFSKMNFQNKKISDRISEQMYRYEEENWLHTLQKITIYSTMSESFSDFFEELIPTELFGDIEKDSIFKASIDPDTISEKMIDSKEPDSTSTEENLTEENFTKKTEKLQPEKLQLDVLLEKSKRDVFRLYRWNAWSRISYYSIGTFLQPYLFERSVKVEATSTNRLLKILPCHVLSSSEDLEVSLIIYQHRLLLQILGNISDVQVRMTHDILYSFDIPAEYKEFDFLWYELPKDPPDKIVISYQVKILNHLKAASKERQQFKNDTKRELVLHFQDYGHFS